MMNDRSRRRVGATVLVFLLVASAAWAQTGRYDSDVNLPFNRKAGEVNPQTGNITITVADVRLAGRGGMDFTFGRRWSLNTAEVFGAYVVPGTGANGLAANTPGTAAGIGVGWRTSDPLIHIDDETGSRVLTLFYEGSAYEIDRGGITVRDEEESNLLGYDLIDKRIYASSAIGYEDYAAQAADSAGLYPALSVLEAENGVDAPTGERSAYELVLRDNSRVWFREDGRLMMKQDPTGLNRIWYFYDRPGYEVEVGESPALVRAAVDTVGRVIAFAYDGANNLTEVSWEVSEGYLAAGGVRDERTVTRRVTYEHRSAADYSEISALTGQVYLYREPYELSAVIDPAGVRTEYTYRAATSRFTYDSTTSHSTNAWLLLEEIDRAVDGADRAFSRQLRYEIPDGSLGTKYFGEGYREYYRLGEQWWEDVDGREMHREAWRYYGNGEAGNFNRYTVVVERGEVTQTYAYSLESDHRRYETLDTLTTETDDGYLALTDYVYAADRTLQYLEEYRDGRFAYDEEYVYDSEGQLLRHTDRLGLETVTDYDPTYGVPVREVRQFNDSYSGEDLRYVKRWELTEIGQIEAERFERTEEGAVRTVTSAAYEYDEYGNPVSVTDAAGHTVYTDYEEARHAFPVHEYHEVTSDAWTAGIAAGWHSEPDTSTTTTLHTWRVFNSDGSIWLEADAAGAVTERYYDEIGRPVATYRADADDPTTFVSEVGLIDLRDSVYLSALLSARINNPGERTAYDDPRAMSEVWTDLDVASGAVLHTAIRENGLGDPVAEITYRDGGEYAVTRMDYDEYGRMIALTDPDATPGGSTIRVNGVAVTRTDRTWIVGTDALGRTTAVLYPETEAGVTAMKRLSYDDATNSVTIVDPEGRAVTERRDWAGNLVEVVRRGTVDTSAAAEQTITTVYDAAGRVVELVDGEGTTTRYQYDERDLLTGQEYLAANPADTTADRHSYDDRGLLVRTVDRAGRTIENSYDERGLLVETTRRFADATVDEVVRAVYDEVGNLAWHQNGTLTSYRTYDERGRLATMSRRFADETIRTALTDAGLTGEEQTFAYTYTDADTIAEMEYPDGSVHRFGYDEQLGHLTRIEEGSDAVSLAPFVEDLSYNLRGVVTTMEYANDTRQSWLFDQRARIEHTEVTHGGALVEELDYTIDGSGNITAINDSTYEYDGFNRIIGARTKLPDQIDAIGVVADHFGAYETAPTVDGVSYAAAADLDGDGRINGADHVAAVLAMHSGGSAYDEETFTYDRAGNRTILEQNGDTYRYTIGERNRVTAIDLREAGETSYTAYAAFEYDEAGNMTSRTVYTTAGPEVTTYTYDSLNRLIATTGPGGTATYAYDGVGNRVWKRDADGLTVYLRHGEIAVAMEVSVPTSDDATIDRYVLSGDLIAGRVRTSGETTERAWYHLDHLNSTKLVTDEDGEVVVSYTYRAFGEQLRRLDADNAETGDEAVYSYGGKELDDTDLYYFNARYYDPALGRFITVDPIQDGENWYAYVRNNPLALVDPTGLEPGVSSAVIEETIVALSQRQVNDYAERLQDLSTVRSRTQAVASTLLGFSVSKVAGYILAGTGLATSFSTDRSTGIAGAINETNGSLLETQDNGQWSVMRQTTVYNRTLSPGEFASGIPGSATYTDSQGNEREVWSDTKYFLQEGNTGMQIDITEYDSMSPNTLFEESLLTEHASAGASLEGVEGIPSGDERGM